MLTYNSKDHEERIAADGVRFAKYNATRLANQTLGDRLYETVFNLNPWNVSDRRPAGMSREDERYMAMRAKQEL